MKVDLIVFVFNTGNNDDAGSNSLVDVEVSKGCNVSTVSDASDVCILADLQPRFALDISVSDILGVAARFRKCTSLICSHHMYRKAQISCQKKNGNHNVYNESERSKFTIKKS